MPTDYSGYWTGQIRGTNTANFTLEVEQDGEALTGVAHFNEPSIGQYRYEITGVASEFLSCKMRPLSQSGQFLLGEVTAIGTLDGAGMLSGKWGSSNGMHGVFSAERFRDAALKDALPVQNSIFIVHGHDEACRLTVARYLEALQLTPVILHEQVNMGKTIIEKFETFASRAGYAIVLATPDDYGYPVGKEEEKRARARQNVVLELGYFVGALGREKTILLVKGDVELPSDLMGVLECRMDQTDGWKMTLARELSAAGFQIDMNLALK